MTYLGTLQSMEKDPMPACRPINTVNIKSDFKIIDPIYVVRTTCRAGQQNDAFLTVAVLMFTCGVVYLIVLQGIDCI